MMHVDKIREGMTVLGSDRDHVGEVESLSGQLLKIRGAGPHTDGSHHYLDIGLIAVVDHDAVVLLVPAAEAKKRWSDEDI
jgi:hypothetical protein